MGFTVYWHGDPHSWPGRCRLGPDPRSALTLKHDLRQRMQAGAAVLLATHSLDIVEHYADRAALMMGGRIVREWSEQELADLRARGIDLESELAAASGDDP